MSPIVLILALNGLEMDRRVENEARLLSSRGFDVTRVGIVSHEGQSELEETDCGRIVRMRPAWHKPASAEPPTSGDSLQPARPLVRQWKPKVWLMTRIRRAWVPYRDSRRRIREWSRWSDEYVATCRALDPDAVIACDLDTLRAGVELKQITGCALVYDMHELWTEQRYHHYFTGYHKWVMRRRETRFLKRADLIITVSKRFAADITKRWPAAEPLVVYSGTDVCNASSQTREEGRLRAYFQGSFTEDRGLEDIIGAMAYLKDSVTLSLQGFGPLESRLREQVRDLGLAENTVRFVRPCSPSDVGLCASEYDVGIVAGTLQSLNARLTTPNRPFAYFAGGLAVITPASLEEIAEIVTEYECGVVVQDDGPEPLARAVASLAQDREELARLKANAARACEAFLWERQFGPVAEFVAASLEHRRMALTALSETKSEHEAAG